MTKMTLEQAATRTLRDVVALACENQEIVVVTGPEGELARIVPLRRPADASTQKYWRGRRVHDAERLARMSPDELKASGWIYPDESDWVDQLSGTAGQQKPD